MAIKQQSNWWTQAHHKSIRKQLRDCYPRFVIANQPFRKREPQIGDILRVRSKPKVISKDN